MAPRRSGADPRYARFESRGELVEGLVAYAGEGLRPFLSDARNWSVARYLDGIDGGIFPRNFSSPMSALMTFYEIPKGAWTPDMYVPAYDEGGWQVNPREWRTRRL